MGNSEKCANRFALSRSQEFANADIPKQNGVAERALGIMQNAALAECIQAPIIFPLVQLSPTESLWAEAVHRSCDALNHIATTANPGNKSPHEMWHGTAAPASPHPFHRPAYCRRNRPSKSFPRAESCFYLGPGIDYPSDSLRVLSRADKVVETRDTTSEATLDVKASLPKLLALQGQGGMDELEDAPEQGWTDDFDSAPTTPLPVLGGGIPYQLRAVFPETPHGVGKESRPPTPAAESSERNQSHPSIPAQARLLARPSLPAPVTPAASVAMLSRQALPPRLYPSFRPPCLPARAPAKSHLGSRCPARGKNNSRPGGTTSRGGSGGSTLGDGTDAARLVPQSHATSHAGTCFRGWQWWRCGSGRHKTGVPLPPTGIQWATVELEEI